MLTCPVPCYLLRAAPESPCSFPIAGTPVLRTCFSWKPGPVNCVRGSPCLLVAEWRRRALLHAGVNNSFGLVSLPRAPIRR